MVGPDPFILARHPTKKPQRWHIDAGAFASPAPHSENQHIEESEIFSDLRLIYVNVHYISIYFHYIII